MTLDYGHRPPQVPSDYVCHDCGATNVRLYRRYQTFLEHQQLRCRKCALIQQRKSKPDSPSEHSIGWLVAAVPTEAGDTYWGYTSVPDSGVEWWNALPKEHPRCSDGEPCDDPNTPTHWRPIAVPSPQEP